MTVTLEEARAWDAADPLAPYRDRFSLPPGVIYLDGNSLGPPPVDSARRLAEVVGRAWGEGLVRSWNDAGWIDAPARVGGKIAGLIGAKANEVIVADSTSVNLYKLLVAALRARPERRKILTEAGDFPTDGYIAQGVAKDFPGAVLEMTARDDVVAALDADVAVLLLSHVHYKTAERRDMARITRLAHAAGAWVLWDLSHSVGALSVDLTACGADLAVGCGYKFLNGGPGAPAFLFIAEPRQAALASPVTGWMGHADPFAFEGGWRAAAGVAGFLCGTPPILSLAALEVGVDLALEADPRLLEAKSARLFDLFVARMDERCGGEQFLLASPKSADARGSHIAFRHPDAYRISQALIARGVVGDFRDPDVLRFGLTPLYLGYEDVWRAVEILAEVTASGDLRHAPLRTPGRVT